MRIRVRFIMLIAGILPGIASFGQVQGGMNNQKVNGYKGIWFTLGQFSEYGDKYSGGLGTYTAKHIPLAIYAPEVEKTFFVYGGTSGPQDRYLLCMVGSYDHRTNTVSRPTVVYDKQGVNDPHDNPSLAIDGDGYLWVFVSGRGRARPGFKFKSREPYNIDGFDQVMEQEMTYPQPKYIPGEGFLHLFTKYTGVRELYFETSKDGYAWTEDKKLAGMKRAEDEAGGHYQISGQHGKKICFFFNWHPNGNVDLRTNIYYMQSTDFGATWTTVDGLQLDVPLSDPGRGPALVKEFFSQGKNIYIKDVNFDENGNPVALYLSGTGHEPGPDGGLREWFVLYWNGTGWENHPVTTSDHNYDMGSLFIKKGKWTVIAPTINTPQAWGGGGEVVMWRSTDKGKTWKKIRQLTKRSTRNHNYIRESLNGKDPFMYFWADGNPGEISESRLYFGDSKGRVWRLPYEMTGEDQQPLRVSTR